MLRLATSRVPIDIRKLIVCNIMSLDGFFEGPDHDVMALPFDQGFGEYNVERLKTADTLLLGKTTFDNFLGTSRASVGPSAA